MTEPNADNVTSIESKKPQTSCRFSIQAPLRGFPITVEGEGRAGDLKLIVDRLIQSGAEPPQVQAVQPTKNGAHLCPVHNSPMKASRKPG